MGLFLVFAIFFSIGLIFSFPAPTYKDAAVQSISPSARKIVELIDGEPDKWEAQISTIYNDSRGITNHTNGHFYETEHSLGKSEDVDIEVNGVNIPGFGKNHAGLANQ